MVSGQRSKPHRGIHSARHFVELHFDLKARIESEPRGQKVGVDDRVGQLGANRLQRFALGLRVFGCVRTIRQSAEFLHRVAGLADFTGEGTCPVCGRPAV